MNNVSERQLVEVTRLLRLSLWRVFRSSPNAARSGVQHLEPAALDPFPRFGQPTKMQENELCKSLPDSATVLQVPQVSSGFPNRRYPRWR